MTNILRNVLALAATGLGMWMFYFFPGWLGLLAGCVLLAVALITTVLGALGPRKRHKVAQTWREFFNFLYGL